MWMLLLSGLTLLRHYLTSGPAKTMTAKHFRSSAP